MLNKYLVHSILDIIINAGNILIKYYSIDNIKYFIKQDGSKVTEADLKSEKYIKNSLQRLTPGILIVSEESAYQVKPVPKLPSTFWLIDPLDNTDGFIKKNDDFVINIALIKNYKSYFGIIYSPIKKLIFYGLNNAGTYKIDLNDNAIQQLVVNSVTLPQSILLLYHELSKPMVYQDIIKFIQPRLIVKNSNTLRIARIAEGEVDIHICLEGCKYWDIAAGHAILRNAMGNIIDFSLKELLYNSSHYVVDSFIAHANVINLYESINKYNRIRTNE